MNKFISHFRRASGEALELICKGLERERGRETVLVFTVIMEGLW